MVVFLNHLLGSVVLVLSLSTDAFAASLGYGASGVSVPRRSILVISAVCSAILAASMLTGQMFCTLFLGRMTRFFCFGLLLLLGVVRLLDNAIKNYIRRHRQLRLRWGGGGFHAVLTIYADTAAADKDFSHSLSAREAATLAVALSLDGVAVGLGAAAAGMNVALPAALSLPLTCLAVEAGCRLGRKLGHTLRLDLSWLSGALLILLAFLRFV